MNQVVGRTENGKALSPLDPRPVLPFTWPSRFPKSRCEGFLVAAVLGGQKACFPSPPPVTHSWDSSAAAPLAMQISRQEEVAKGLFAINTRLVSNARKPGMICKMAGEGTGPRADKKSLPFHPFPSPLTHQSRQLPSPTTQNPAQTIRYQTIPLSAHHPPSPSCRPPRRAPNPTLDHHLASSGRLSDPTHWPPSQPTSSSNIGRTQYSTAVPSAPTAGGNARRSQLLFTPVER